MDTTTKQNNDEAYVKAYAIAVGLVPVMRELGQGRCAVALAGSFSKGKGDAHSDIDFWVFADEAKPNAQRREIVNALTTNIAGAFVGEEPDGSYFYNEFEYANTRVEATLQSISHVQSLVDECLNGEIVMRPAIWTINGHYNHCLLSVIKAAQPMHDPAGVIAHWQEQLAIFPPKLKAAMLDYHVWRAGFWLDNFHYLSAIRRRDVVYTSGIVQNSLHHLILSLFAINDTYFPGDKKSLDYAAGFNKKPAGFVDAVRQVLLPCDANALPQQREVLKRLWLEVKALAENEA